MIYVSSEVVNNHPKYFFSSIIYNIIFQVFTLSIFSVPAWSNHFEEFIKPWLIPKFLPFIQVNNIFCKM